MAGRLLGDGVLPGTPAEKDLKRLAKRYPSVREDIGRELKLLDENGPDRRTDDEIPGFGGEVWKRRVKNSDNQKGKSGGYRLVYAVFQEGIAVVTVYAKSDVADAPPGAIAAAMAEMRRACECISQEPERAAEIAEEYRDDDEDSG